MPRWRSLGATLKSQELASPRIAAPTAAELPTELLAYLEKWHLSPGLVTAAELVEAAIVSGNDREAIDAARRLVAMDQNAAPLIREQAARLLSRTGHGDEIPAGVIPRRGSAAFRGRLRAHPRDALAWVELALQQTIRGHTEAALRSMTVARGIAPSNRHVLRSSARLFLHDGSPDKAHSIIARNPATLGDPWLIASEIALAEIAERRSKFLKAGQRIVASDDHLPRQITELAGAVATEELISGNRRSAKRNFAKSMLDPTGSALAQGEWATPTVGEEIVPPSRFCSAPEPSEAVAMHQYRRRDFEQVPHACNGWIEADPFSIRPFEFACATLGLVGAYDASLEFAKRGLEIRPQAATLLNAAAFALASMGEPQEALRYLGQMPKTGTEEFIPYLTAANQGLASFRLGDSPAGIVYYGTAIDGFRRLGNHEMSARARLFLAREAVLAELPNAQQLLAEARKANERFKEGDAGILLSQLENVVGLASKEKFGLNH